MQEMWYLPNILLKEAIFSLSLSSFCSFCSFVVLVFLQWVCSVHQHMTLFIFKVVCSKVMRFVLVLSILQFWFLDYCMSNLVMMLSANRMAQLHFSTSLFFFSSIPVWAIISCRGIDRLIPKALDRVIILISVSRSASMALSWYKDDLYFLIFLCFCLHLF